MKWVKNIESVQKVQSLATFFAAQDRCLQDTADLLYHLRHATLDEAK